MNVSKNCSSAIPPFFRFLGTPISRKASCILLWCQKRKPIPAKQRPAATKFRMTSSRRCLPSSCAWSRAKVGYSVILRPCSAPAANTGPRNARPAVATASETDPADVSLLSRASLGNSVQNLGQRVEPAAASTWLAAGLARYVGEIVKALVLVPLDGQDIGAGRRKPPKDLLPGHGVHLHLRRAGKPARMVVAHIPLDAHPHGGRPDREPEALGRIAGGHPGRHLGQHHASGGQDADELSQVTPRVARGDVLEGYAAADQVEGVVAKGPQVRPEVVHEAHLGVAVLPPGLVHHAPRDVDPGHPGEVARQPLRQPARAAAKIERVAQGQARRKLAYPGHVAVGLRDAGPEELVARPAVALLPRIGQDGEIRIGVAEGVPVAAHVPEVHGPGCLRSTSISKALRLKLSLRGSLLPGYAAGRSLLNRRTVSPGARAMSASLTLTTSPAGSCMCWCRRNTNSAPWMWPGPCWPNCAATAPSRPPWSSTPLWLRSSTASTSAASCSKRSEERRVG